MSTGLIDQALDYIADKLPIIGNTYSASWAASSSSAASNSITQKMSLPKGTYAIIIQIPTASRTMWYQLTNISSSMNRYWQIASAGTASVIVTFSSTTDVQLQTAGSESVTWSNQERGGISAVRIA